MYTVYVYFPPESIKITVSTTRVHAKNVEDFDDTCSIWYLGQPTSRDWDVTHNVMRTIQEGFFLDLCSKAFIYLYPYGKGKGWDKSSKIRGEFIYTTRVWTRRYDIGLITERRKHNFNLITLFFFHAPNESILLFYLKLTNFTAQSSRRIIVVEILVLRKEHFLPRRSALGKYKSLGVKHIKIIEKGDVTLLLSRV